MRSILAHATDDDLAKDLTRDRTATARTGRVRDAGYGHGGRRRLRARSATATTGTVGDPGEGHG
ncbi:hypothetical protein [Streptomyces phaeoluteigriseus]